MAKVRVPTPLQKLTENQSEVVASGATVREVLASLESQYAGMKERLYDEQGNLRRFVNIFVNNEDIRFLKGEDTEVADESELSIVPAIAGG
jgi:sulfur-carrier protein